MGDFGISEGIIHSSNFNEMCRTCTKSNPDSLHKIFNTEICIPNEEEPISTSEVLFAVSNLKMLPDDDLPKGICIQCLESLKKAYHFQKMCLLSDLTIRSLKLQNGLPISSKKDQSSRKEDIKGESVCEPIFGHCDVTVIDVLKNEQPCHERKTQVYIQQRRNIKEEEYENSSDSPDKNEGDYDDNIESIISESKEELLTVKKEAISEPIDQQIEKPNPRNKRSACFICEDCGKSFDRQHRLHRHISVHKKDGRPFECEQCKRRFAQEGHLRRHAITHDKTFLEKTELKNIDGHQCPDCPRKFLKQVSLASHMRTHRKETDMCKPYQCEECPKIFEGIQRLNRHKKLHEKNHKFICDTCGQSFGIRSHLIDHLTKHSGIKPHICRYCEKCLYNLFLFTSTYSMFLILINLIVNLSQNGCRKKCIF